MAKDLAELIENTGRNNEVTDDILNDLLKRVKRLEASLGVFLKVDTDLSNPNGPLHATDEDIKKLNKINKDWVEH